MRTPAAAPAFLADLVAALYARAREPSPPARIANMLVIDEPRDIDRIAKAPDLFKKNYFLVSAVGRSRFNTDGEEWTARRDVTQPQYLAAGRPQARQAVYQAYSDQLTAVDPAAPLSMQRSVFAASLSVFHSALGVTTPVGDVIGAMERARDLVRRLQFQSWRGAVYQSESEVEADKNEVLDAFHALIAASPAATALLSHLSARAPTVAGFA